MSPGIDDILGNFAPKGGDPRIVAELERIRNAVELTAAIEAHKFFKAQASDKAAAKLQIVIQRNAAKLANQP